MTPTSPKRSIPTERSRLTDDEISERAPPLEAFRAGGLPNRVGRALHLVELWVSPEVLEGAQPLIVRGLEALLKALAPA
jgi:hypothetical protein